MDHRTRIVAALVDHLVFGFELQRPPHVPRRRWWRAIKQAAVWLERRHIDRHGRLFLPWREQRRAPLLVVDLLHALNRVHIERVDAVTPNRWRASPHLKAA